MIVKVSKTAAINGDVKISGAKNSALPILCAALVLRQTVRLENIPVINDVTILEKLLIKMGVKIKKDKSSYVIKSMRIKKNVLYDEVSLIRGSYYLMGALLARHRRLKIKYPGGCNLGSRPIDFHLQAFEKLGFLIDYHGDYIYISERKRQPAVITFPKKSVGATINTILLATSIKGTTVITNPALEPEVIDVITFLNKGGCQITVSDTREIKIAYANKLKGCQHKVISDRIEAGSFLFLAASLPHSVLTINNVNHEHLEQVIEVATQMGVDIEKAENSLIVRGVDTVNSLDVVISEHPSFPTDLQPLLSVFMLRSEKSTIKDLVFPRRISQIDEIKKMNGKMEYQNEQIVVYESELEHAIVEAKDLRNAMALIIAAAMAKGTSFIDNIQVLLRGYENIIYKLQKIGLNIEIVDI